MASGDLAYCDPRDFFICIPWEPPSCYVSTYNGFEYYYEDGQGGYYCGSGDYCCSGYFFFNQSQFGCGNFFSDLTGNFCCSAYSDGTGSYYWNTIYYSGTILCTNNCYICIPNIICILNGFVQTISDGVGSTFNCNYYCPAGYSLYESGNYDFVSNGAGYFTINEKEKREIYKVKIDWDFTKDSKDKYFSPSICANGQDLSLSYSDNEFLFFEIDSICETNLYITEACLSKSLCLDFIFKPFIYIKNIGCENLKLKTSNCISYFSYSDFQYLNQDSICNLNITLNPKDYAFISLVSSTDGGKYYSVYCYPFGFFYEFKNVKQYNELGLYPVCCFLSQHDCNYYPNYLYQNLSNIPLDSCFINGTGLESCYSKIKSNYFDSFVDKYSFLEISLEKCIDASGYNCLFKINNISNINLNVGQNYFNSSIKTNCILFLNESENEICCLDPANNIIYSDVIYKDLNLKILYDFDVTTSKVYKVNYLNKQSGNSTYDLCFYKNDEFNNLKIAYDSNYLQDNSGIFELDEKEKIYVSIDTCENTAIVDLVNSNLNRKNMFLPVKAFFDYNYCFELARSNFNNASQSGSFIDNYLEIDLNSGFINCSFLIDCSEVLYQENKACLFNLCLNLNSENFSTCNILNKNLLNISDDFVLTKNSLQCSFFYCGLEFKYFPIADLCFARTNYLFTDNYLTFNFEISGCCIPVNMPVNSINRSKLKLSVQYDICDYLYSSISSLNYSGLNFNKEICLCNNINTIVPIIKKENLTEYEYPSLSLLNKICSSLLESASISVNYLNNIDFNDYYDLNNLLLFVFSQLNGGVATNFDCTYYANQCFDLFELLKNTNDGIYYWRNPNCEYYYDNDYTMYGNYNDYFNEISGYYVSSGCSGFSEFNVQYDESGNLTTGYIIKNTKLECTPNYLPCDYEYGSSNYNFLMMDLFNEYNECNFLIPSGSFLQVDCLVSKKDINSKNYIISFKTNTGKGYNYIAPIPNNFNYSDCYSVSGENYNCYSCISGVLNDVICRINYDGSSLTSGYLFDESGVTTGYYLCKADSSIVNYDHDNVTINIPYFDIINQSGRCLNFCRQYSFSGIQPILSNFNYQMLDIKYPILYNNFKLYCEIPDSCDLTGMFLYYIYDITGLKKCQISIVSPEFTNIALISWTDASGSKSIFSNFQDKNHGQMQGNVARINFDISEYASSNNYVYDTGNSLLLCIGVIGSI